MARVEDTGKAYTWLKRGDHDGVHLIINNVSDLSEIDRVDDFIVTVVLVAIQIFRLTSVARVVEKQRVVWSGVLDEPVHRSEHVLLCRLTHWVLLVVCQDDHVIPLIVELGMKICGHVLDVVDATPELTFLTKIVDTNQERLSSTCAVGILKGVAAWSSVTEVLDLRRWWRRRAVVSLDVSVVLV